MSKNLREKGGGRNGEKGEVGMEKTLRSEFETLWEVLKVKEMTERGIYVSYYDDVRDLHDSGYHSDLDLNNTKDFEVFREIVEEQYLEKYDNLNKPFVTFEKQGVTNWEVFFDKETLIDDILEYMRSNRELSKYVQERQVSNLVTVPRLKEQVSKDIEEYRKTGSNVTLKYIKENVEELETEIE